jgi:hypothetical protein
MEGLVAPASAVADMILKADLMVCSALLFMIYAFLVYSKVICLRFIFGLGVLEDLLFPSISSIEFKTLWCHLNHVVDHSWWKRAWLLLLLVVVVLYLHFE